MRAANFDPEPVLLSYWSGASGPAPCDRNHAARHAFTKLLKLFHCYTILYTTFPLARHLFL